MPPPCPDILLAGFEVGVRYGRVKPGDVLAVVGAGPVGLASIMTAGLCGAARVIALDLDDNRLKKAKAVGATDVVNNGAEDWIEQVKSMTDGFGVDVAIEAVGVPDTFDACTKSVRPGGSAANVGVHGAPVELALQDLRGFGSSSQHQSIAGVSMGRSVTGAAPLTEKRRRFAELIGQGVSNAEACRQVGVHIRTGMRWQHGRKVVTERGELREYPSVLSQKRRVLSLRYLSEDERVVVADMLTRRRSLRAIAAALGRSPSTISREIRRNRDARGRYRPFAAHQLAVARRARPRERKLERDLALRAFVREKLSVRWSPEQIANETRTVFVDQPGRHIVHETIYQTIYGSTVLDIDRDLPVKPLRSGRRRRRPRRGVGARRAGALVAMTSIHDRPAEAEDRTVVGHWEGDLIIGERNRSAIITLVERTSRLILLGYVPDGRHTAPAVSAALVQAMTVVPAHLRRSLAWDQGKEMALHHEVAEALDMPVFFCDIASPWQRPSNENSNGLLRQYFPKGADLRIHGPEDLAHVADELNSRPRKTMQWQTPHARYTALSMPSTTSTSTSSITEQIPALR